MSLIQKHNGRNIVLTASATVAAGDVMQVGSLFGVAKTAAATGEQYVLTVGGVYDVTLSGSEIAISAGDVLRWDSANEYFVLDDSYPIAAIATEAADASATSVEAKLCSELSKSEIVIDGTIDTNSAVAAETVSATATIPANTLKVGDTIEATAAGTATSTTSTEKSQMRLRLGGVGGSEIATTEDLDIADADLAGLQATCHITAVGASGKFNSIGLGYWTTSGAVVTQAVIKQGNAVSNAALTIVGTIEQDSTGNDCTFDWLRVRIKRAS